MKRAPIGALILSLPLLLLLVVPPLALVARGVWPSWSEEVRDAIRVSLLSTGVSAGAILLFGTPLAIVLGRKRLFGRGVLESLVTFPAVLPPAAAGLALLLAFGKNGWIGGWLDRHNLSPSFTVWAVVLAQVYVAAPFFIRPLAAALREIGPELREAAALDGANPGQTALKIDFALVRGTMFAALSLAWARALGEFGATILFAGNRQGETQTLPLAIAVGFESDLDVAIGLATVLLAIAVAVLAVASLLNRREST